MKNESELLPAVIGFTPDHLNITQQLVRRVLTLLAESEGKPLTYGMRDSPYGIIEETLKLELGGVTLTIELSTKK